MSLFGIGPLELIFILIIMILVLGPKNMVTAAKSLGVTLRKIVKSPMWTSIMDTSREIREIPTKLIRDAGIEEDLKSIKQTTDSIKNVGNISVTTDSIVTNMPKKSDIGKNIGKDKDVEKKILPDKPLEKTEVKAQDEPEKITEKLVENPSPEPDNPPSEPVKEQEQNTDTDGNDQDTTS